MNNSWISVRDDFVMGNTDHEVGPISDNAQILMGHSHDWSTVGGFYPNENAAGRTWQLWSIYYPTKAETDAAVAALASNNPGRTKELGQWDYATGAQTENQYPQLQRYMPDGVTLEDVNVLAGQSPRQFT